MIGSPLGEYEPKPACIHDSTRADGTLDDCCLRCGTAGWWHNGHKHYEIHPSGSKCLIRLECPDNELQSYLDEAIIKWREHRVTWIQDKEMRKRCECYIDAFQSVRKSMLGATLP